VRTKKTKSELAFLTAVRPTNDPATIQTCQTFFLTVEPVNTFSIFVSGSDPTMLGDRSRERRRMAAECLALAKQVSDSGVRASLLEMAQKWLDLAELSDHAGWNEALRLRALEAAIGQELRALYELPQKLPHRLLNLLMQLNTEADTD
jgi:hypothetical protein